ncbi:MAG: PLP-dependent aminotransferase family protein [Bacillota bacterium]
MGRSVSIQLDRDSALPLYLQLGQALIRQIEAGKLRPNDQLPTIRRLARELAVNPVTVVSAYRLLEEKGYVTARVGSGTYVNPLAPWREGRRVGRERLVPSGEGEELLAEVQGETDGGQYDLASASIPPELFPVESFRAALNEVLQRDGGHAFSYQGTMGYLPLRQTIRSFIAEEYGIEAEEQEIHVVSGAQQGIDIIARTLLDLQDVVGVESPTYPGAADAFRARGARIMELPMADDGPDLDEVEARLRSRPPRLVYVMPHFQNPTGISYSLEKKRALLDLAGAHGFLIVEDDSMNDLYYREKPVPLKALDRSGRVIYIKSFSKVFMPGLRLGFVVAPAALGRRLAETKQYTDITSSGLTQRALDLILRQGLLTSHLQEIRQLYSARWEMVKSALARHLPREVRYTSPDGGLLFWASLPEGFYSMHLYGEAHKRGLRLVPGDFFYPDRRPVAGFRLSYARLAPGQIDQAIQELAEAIDELIAGYPVDPWRGGRERFWL